MTICRVVESTTGFSKSFTEETVPELGLEDWELEKQGGRMAEGRPAFQAEGPGWVKGGAQAGASAGMASASGWLLQFCPWEPGLPHLAVGLRREGFGAVRTEWVNDQWLVKRGPGKHCPGIFNGKCGQLTHNFQYFSNGPFPQLIQRPPHLDWAGGPTSSVNVSWRLYISVSL